MEANERTVVLVFKAFCDENPIRILELLRGGEKCACKLPEALNISQPTLSHSMKILCPSGLVTGRKKGKWMRYAISTDGAKQVPIIPAAARSRRRWESTCAVNTGRIGGWKTPPENRMQTSKPLSMPSISISFSSGHEQYL